VESIRPSSSRTGKPSNYTILAEQEEFITGSVVQKILRNEPITFHINWAGPYSTNVRNYYLVSETTGKTYYADKVIFEKGSASASSTYSGVLEV